VEFFKVARGYDPADACSRRSEPSLHLRADGFVCGVPRASQLEFYGDTHAANTFERGVAMIERSGGRIVEIDYAPFRETGALLYQGPWIAERLAGFREFFARHQDAMHPVTRAIIAGAENYSAVDALSGLSFTGLEQRARLNCCRDRRHVQCRLRRLSIRSTSRSRSGHA
jgi:allophanate hydrolase